MADLDTELLELKKLEMLQAAVAKPTPDAESPGSIEPFSPENPKQGGALGKVIDWLYGQSMVPPASDDQGNLVYPQATKEDADIAKRLAATGLEIGGAVVAPELLGGQRLIKSTGMLPDAARTAMTAVESAGGSAVMGKVSEALGLKPPTTMEDTIDQAAQDITLGTAAGVGLNSLAKIAGWFRQVIPSRAAVEFKESQKLGSTAAALNAPRGTTNREAQLVEDIIPREETLIRLNPTQGIDPSDPKAFEKFQANIESIKKGALKEKNSILSTVDSEAKKLYDQAEKAGVKPKRGVTFEVEDFLKSREDLTEGAEREIRALYKELFQKKVDTGIVSGSEAVMRDSAKELTVNDLQYLIRRKFDNELRKLGAFDDLQLSKIATDPSAYAKIKDKIDAYKTMRSVTSKGVLDYSKRILGPEAAAKIDDANEAIAAMIEYENLADRFYVEGLQGMTPGSGRSMTTLDPSALRNKFGVLDVATGGTFSDMADLQRRQANLTRGNEAVQSISNIVDYRTGAMSPPLSVREVAPEALAGAADAAPRVTPMLPDIQGFFRDPMLPQTLAQMGLSPELQQEAAAVQNLGREEKEQTMGKILQETRGKGIFPPSPVDGISSFIPSNSPDFVGKVTDKMEREKIRGTIDLREQDPLRRMRMLSALNKDGTLLELPDYLRADSDEPKEGIEVPKESLNPKVSKKADRDF